MNKIESVRLISDDINTGFSIWRKNDYRAYHLNGTESRKSQFRKIIEILANSNCSPIFYIDMIDWILK